MSKHGRYRLDMDVIAKKFLGRVLSQGVKTAVADSGTSEGAIEGESARIGILAPLVYPINHKVVILPVGCRCKETLPSSIRASRPRRAHSYVDTSRRE